MIGDPLTDPEFPISQVGRLTGVRAELDLVKSGVPGRETEGKLEAGY